MKSKPGLNDLLQSLAIMLILAGLAHYYGYTSFAIGMLIGMLVFSGVYALWRIYKR